MLPSKAATLQLGLASVSKGRYSTGHLTVAGAKVLLGSSGQPTGEGREARFEVMASRLWKSTDRAPMESEGGIGGSIAREKPRHRLRNFVVDDRWLWNPLQSTVATTYPVPAELIREGDLHGRVKRQASKAAAKPRRESPRREDADALAALRISVLPKAGACALNKD